MPGKALQRGNQIRANALWHKGRGRVGFGVHGPGAAVGANWHAAHALHATGDHQVFPAGAHFLGRHVHGFQAGGAKAVDLHARAGEIPACFQRGHLGNHRALLPHGRDHAHDHIVYFGRVEVIAALQLAQHARQQVDGLYLIQAAVFFSFAARGADGIKHKCFSHGGSSSGTSVKKQSKNVVCQYILYTKQLLCVISLIFLTRRHHDPKNPLFP